MLAALIIVFREIIEAGLVVGIVMAATRGVRGRAAWVAGGIAVGALGSALVAAFAGTIASAFEGVGQELFNAAIMALAVVMLASHSIWMSRHGRQVAAGMAQAGRAVAEGQSSLAALALVVGVAILREGSEVVLFLYGVAVGGGGSSLSLLGGGLLGLALGAALSGLTYAGLVTIPPRRLFAVTTAMITVLAAGMAAQCVAFLEQAGAVTALGDAAWDSSALLSETSVPGRVLHTLVGYSDQPTGLQLLVYAATLAAITAATLALRPARAPARPAMLGA